jgi:hypothetical protein
MHLPIPFERSSGTLSDYGKLTAERSTRLREPTHGSGIESGGASFAVKHLCWTFPIKADSLTPRDSLFDSGVMTGLWNGRSL